MPVFLHDTINKKKERGIKNKKQGVFISHISVLLILRLPPMPRHTSYSIYYRLRWKGSFPRLTRLLLGVVLLLWALTGCAPTEVGEGRNLMHYAHRLTLFETDSMVVATVRNPWDTTTVLQQYVLVPRDRPLPRVLPKGILLRTPLRRTVMQSSVHAALAERLGTARRVQGICDARFVVSRRVKALLLTDYGSSMQPDVERLVADSVDALFVAPFENVGHGALDASEIPLIECADYMETTPLGRAEWMRFYGRLWGCAERADSLMAAEVEQYESLRREVAEAQAPAPTLLIDRKEGAPWYVPGGDSYLAALYRDAGARYVFAAHRGAGSVALDVETVLAEGRAADLWVIKYGAAADLTLSALAADNPLYRQFRAFQQQRVMGCNTLREPYYEELPFAPSRLLTEWVRLLHPSLVKQPATPPFFTPLRVR